MVKETEPSPAAKIKSRLFILIKYRNQFGLSISVGIQMQHSCLSGCPGTWMIYNMMLFKINFPEKLGTMVIRFGGFNRIPCNEMGLGCFIPAFKKICRCL